MGGMHISTYDDAAGFAVRATTGTDINLYDAASFVIPLGGEFARSALRSSVAPFAERIANKKWGVGKFAGSRFAGVISPFQSALAWNTKRKLYNSWENDAAKRFSNVFYANRGVGQGFGSSLKAALSMTPKTALMSKGASMMVSLGNAAFLAPLVYEGGKAIASGLSMIGGDYSKPDYSTAIMDTQQAATQRQAGLAAIHNSQLQTRSFFGREALAFHA